MNAETRVIIVHTTSYEENLLLVFFFFKLRFLFLIRTLASLIVKQASNMSLTGPEYMWIMSSIVLRKFTKTNKQTNNEDYLFY